MKIIVPIAALLLVWCTNAELAARIIVPPNGAVNTVVTIPPGPRATGVPSKGESLRLHNGDTFRGRFLSYHPQSGFVWQHPSIAEPLTVAPSSVATLSLDEESNAGEKAHACRVKLVNGDFVTGDLVALADGKITLDTWYAGRLTIPQASIATLMPGRESKLTAVYRGPKDQKDWTRSGGNWNFKDGIFTSTSSSSMLGRDFPDMPDQASFDFEADWVGSLSLYVNLCTDRFNSYSSCNAYNLRIAQTYAYVYRYTMNNNVGSGRRIGNRINMNLAGAKQSAKISIKIDKARKLVALYINGKFISKWQDTLDFVGKKNGILFTTRTSNRIQIRNISLSRWDGSLPGGTGTNPVAAKEGNMVLLQNNDALKATVEKLEGEKLHIRSSFGDIPLPMKQVNVIHMNPAKTAPVEAGTAKVTMGYHASMSFKIKSWQDGKVQIDSPIFGMTELKEAAIERVIFRKATVAPPTPPTTNPPPRPVPPVNDVEIEDGAEEE